MLIEQGHPVVKALKYTNVSSSTWYRRKKVLGEDRRAHNKGRPIPGYSVNPDGSIITDETIVNAVKEIRKREFFQYGGGYKKLVHYLRRDFNIYVNGKKLYRLCKEHGLLLHRKKKRWRRGRRVCENRKITGPNQLWQFDIKYGYVAGENRFFYLMAFIDVFHREIVDYHIGLSCSAKDIVFTLENALEKRCSQDLGSLVIRSDNGTQMTSHVFKRSVEKLGLGHEFIPPATPNKNAFIESFFSILDRELYRHRAFETYREAYRAVVEFIDFYNNKRLHGSLKNRPPREALKGWAQEVSVGA